MNKLNVLYARVSSLEQKTDRQRINENEFNLVIEDKCSGAIPFHDRQGGKQILSLIEKGILKSLSVITIDRLGRNLREILNTIHFFTERQIPIIFLNQNLRTIDNDGNENTITKLMISILGTVAEMERNQIRERQLEGIKLAKARGIYKGRKAGTKEDVHKFLDKPKNKKALDYIKKGYKLSEAGKLANVNLNTMTKIKRLAFPNQ
ncbi:MAG: recombinase family protein [Paludibacter sp.]|jgi:DNA invertase Pin-like site-specific DNA recombinase|nr:recombinase family protein [Paludibacter sp.]